MNHQWNGHSDPAQPSLTATVGESHPRVRIAPISIEHELQAQQDAYDEGVADDRMEWWIRFAVAAVSLCSIGLLVAVILYNVHH